MSAAGIFGVAPCCVHTHAATLAACPAFGHHIAAERVTHVLDRVAPLRRAQKFPEAASRRIALSNSASAKSRFSLAFSFSRSFSRLAWSVRRPPYSRFQR